MNPSLPSGSRPRLFIHRRFFWIALLPLLAMGFWLLAPLVSKASRPMVEVQRAEASWARMVRYERATGRVVNLATRKIEFQSAGVVSRIHVHEGETVRKGQPLAELGPDREVEQRFATALIELENARRAVGRADEEAARMRALYEAGIESRSAAELKQQAAQDSRVKLAQAEITLKGLRQQKDARVLVADADGQVMTVDVAVGEPLHGRGIKLIDPQQNIVEARVDEQTAVQLEVGQTVLYETASAAGRVQRGEGRVTEVRPSFEKERDFYAVKVFVGIPGADIAALKLNQQLQLRFAVEVKERALAIPTSALVSEKGRQFVLALAGDRTRRVAVETGIEQNDQTEIRSGELQAGQAIAIPLMQPPADGEPVHVRTAP